MNQRECDFFLPKENHEKALQAVKAATQENSWLSRFGDADSIGNFLKLFCWTPQFDDNGNIDGLYFEGDKSWKELDLFQIIAPFVKAGSFIEMDGEDGVIWRFCFDGKTCFEKYPEIKWD